MKEKEEHDADEADAEASISTSNGVFGTLRSVAFLTGGNSSPPISSNSTQDVGKERSTSGKGDETISSVGADIMTTKDKSTFSAAFSAAAASIVNVSIFHINCVFMA